MKYIAASLAFCLATIDARLNHGQCLEPSTITMEDFELTKYAGTWFSIMKDPQTSFQWRTKCNYNVAEMLEGDFDSEDYKDSNEKPFEILEGYEVKMKLLSSKQSSKTQKDTKGVLVCSTTDAADCYVDYNAKKGKGVVGDAKFAVLDTDYDNYAVIYMCNQAMRNFNTQWVWVLSRNPTMEEGDLNLEKAKKVIADKLGEEFDVDSLEMIKQGPDHQCQYKGTEFEPKVEETDETVLDEADTEQPAN